MPDNQTLIPNDPAEGSLDVTWSLEEYTDWKGEGVEIEALLRDACSGTASAQLIVQTQDHSVSVEPASLKGDGHGYRMATFAFPRSWLDKHSTLTIRAVDDAGNVARKKLISPLGAVSRKKPSR